MSIPRGYSYIIITLLAFLIATLLAAPGTEGSTVVFEDDFTGTNGDPPDPTKWERLGVGSGDTLDIQDNNLRLQGSCKANGTITCNSSQFTFLVDAKAISTSGRCVSVGAISWDDGVNKAYVTVCYDAYWGWHYWRKLGGNSDELVSWRTNVVRNVWYRVNLTVSVNKFNISVHRISDNALMWSVSDVTCDPFSFENTAGLNLINSHVRYDNAKLVDLAAPPNQPPEWSSMPSLTAVEDVVLKYNFTFNVTDPDDVVDDLFITSFSTYVTSTSGLEVNFLFPNGVLEVDVPLELSDGRLKVQRTVHVDVIPVNDPPGHSIPAEVLATEDVPLTLNLTPSVYDIDNGTGDLSLLLEPSPYVSADGLLLTALFPDGVLQHQVAFNITDGLLRTRGTITFQVQAVDDPPEVGELPIFNATEDRVSVFDVRPYLTDIDTPLDDLRIVCRAPHCTVNGLNLSFDYTFGGVEHTVNLQVNDGTSMVDASMIVRVVEVNDAPLVHPVFPALFTEDEVGTVDLAEFVVDEDDDLENLTLTCDHDAVVAIEGFEVSLLYEVWTAPHNVTFQVTDGYLYATGSFEVQVEEVNDPPTGIFIGDLIPPVVIIVDEGEQLWFDIVVEDEDDDVFEYLVESDWSGVMVFSNGSLRITTTMGEVDEYDVKLTVDDRNGGNVSLPFRVEVRDVNEPPSKPTIVSPINHSVHTEGDNITFHVQVIDPDTPLGEIVTVTWVSNISGKVEELTSDGELGFVTDSLPVGRHRITVTANDGEFVRETWFDISVIEAYEPPPPPPPDDDPVLQVGSTGFIILVVAVLIILVAFVMVVMSRRSTEEEEPAPVVHDHEGEQWVDQEEEPGPEVEPDLKDLAQQLDGMATALEAQRDADKVAPVDDGPPPHPVAAPVPAPAAAPAAEPERSPLPDGEEVTISAEEAADREHARGVRDVMKALTQMPRGLPTALWGKDMSQLAREIVDGERRREPDGTELVLVDGRWYEADHTNLGRFLREHKEEAAEADLSAKERAKRLEQLEERLLEGKISEQTYERLRKKYSD